MSTGLILGIDIGGTKIAAGLVEPESGRLMKSSRAATPRGGNEVLLGAVVGIARSLLGGADLPVAGIGIGIPGGVDRDQGVAISACNLDFREMPVRAYLEERLSRPCFLENDTNAGALGEKWFGAGRDLQDFVYLSIGTGIGGGLVLGRRLYLGRGAAGEVGHMVVDADGPECVCGSPGCLEALASGPAIAKLARARLEAGMESTLGATPTTSITAKEVIQAAQAGDPLAAQVMEQVGRNLAVACLNLRRLLDPKAIIISGGIAEAGRYLLELIIGGAARLGCSSALEELLVLSPLGSESGVMGAAAVALERGVCSS